MKAAGVSLAERTVLRRNPDLRGLPCSGFEAPRNLNSQEITLQVPFTPPGIQAAS